MTTLIIHYLPSGENSRTRRLLQCFQAEVAGPVETLDLLETPPPFITREIKDVLFKRSYLGQTLTDAERVIVARNDRFLNALRAADHVVFAYPMYNYSMPACVKAFFDAVIIKGETFDFEDGAYRGLLTGKRALALITSGGIYEAGTPFADLDCCFKLHKTLCGFVGFDTADVISVQGTDMVPAEALEPRFVEAEQAIRSLCGEWTEAFAASN